MIRFTESNPEVLYAVDPIVQVTRQDIAELIQRAAGLARKRARICAHKDAADKLHEMLIVLDRDTYIRPHKHLDKSESFHVVEGAADVVIFDDAGNISEIVRMGDYGSGKTFFYRLAHACFHTVLVRSKCAVIHETTNGPFNRADTIFAPWAPEESAQAGRERFVKRLADQAEDFQRNHQT